MGSLSYWKLDALEELIGEGGLIELLVYLFLVKNYFHRSSQYCGGAFWLFTVTLRALKQIF